MGWTKALLTMWSSKKSSSGSSSSSYQPVFSVDRTEIDVAATVTGVPELTLHELNKATRSFSPASVLGQAERLNNATVVYRATVAIGTSKVPAVAKKLGSPPPGTSWSASHDEFLRQQVLVLSRLRHHNVVRLLGYTIDASANVRVLLFEFAEMGTLHDVLHGTDCAGPTGEPEAEASSSSRSRPARTTTTTLSWAQRTGVALDVARGLEYLHDAAAVSHCGISSSKVLLFQGFRAKIADYDLLMRLPRDADKDAYTFVGTPLDKTWHLMTGCRSSRVDVYSYGVLLLELLTGRKRCAAMNFFPMLLDWASPLVREGRVEGFMDPKLGTHYPRARALKLAQIALCCVDEKPQSRPSMADVAETISCYILSSKTSKAK